MSDELVPYTVRQGDYMTKLAARYGFDAKAVWTDPKNDAIRAQRDSMDLLCPCDIVYLPMNKPKFLSVNVGSVNKFKGTLPTVVVNLRFQNADGTPIASEPYEVDGAGPDLIGTSGGDGTISLTLSVATEGITLRFPHKGLAFPVGVGHLDPITEPSGHRQRLAHLGFLDNVGIGPNDPDGANDDGNANDGLFFAICAFQSAHGLDPSGNMDAATQTKLRDVHGG